MTLWICVYTSIGYSPIYYEQLVLLNMLSSKKSIYVLSVNFPLNSALVAILLLYYIVHTGRI